MSSCQRGAALALLLGCRGYHHQKNGGGSGVVSSDFVSPVLAWLDGNSRFTGLGFSDSLRIVAASEPQKYPSFPKKLIMAGYLLTASAMFFVIA